MHSLLLVFALCGVAQDATTLDPKSLIDVLESLQPSLRDFTCEYEGQLFYLDQKVKNEKHLDLEGLYQFFDGKYVWRRDGNILADSYHRTYPGATILHETYLIRAKENEAEHYIRNLNQPIGQVTITPTRETSTNVTGCFGEIFLIDELERRVKDLTVNVEITEDIVDSRKLVIFSVYIKGIHQLTDRFWIDLRRGGLVVRRESYARGEVLVGKLEILLEQYTVDGKVIWLPKSGLGEGHAALTEDLKPYTSVEPTTKEIIYMIRGSLDLNSSPSDNVFKANYKLGTPVSNSLKNLKSEFGRQSTKQDPSKKDVEQMLKLQIKEMELQNSELAINELDPNAFSWAKSAVWIFGAICLAISLVMRRRR